MKRILVVDDSGTIRKAIRRILEQLEYTVTEAEDGAQALHVLVAGDPFDAVLCDIDMPVMDGLSFLTAVAGQNAVVPPPIIMCTTHTSFDKVETALTLGASEYIMKPFDATIIGSKLGACGVQ
ncbi:MAG: response regulator [Gemmatimonadaceae bacterium]|nr:response regulator [Gemmatimonadaceae bacterium]